MLPAAVDLVEDPHVQGSFTSGDLPQAGIFHKRGSLTNRDL
ncbi:hypothetical protein Q31b_16420 [Novipirellula aureliae]|uniref:Uncharacterized protein n=1 Tax=Novipirellula aureliae TaxID=2527966 RepID=A0A5C6E804_9BACT|nr:hypothetical protein Q31b_16420 [Novipirellula aureliae]